MDDISRNKAFNLFYLKVGLILFWCAWFTIVCTSNIFDYLNALHLLPAAWPFKSGNYTLVLRTVDIYNTPHWLVNFLFLGDISIQGLSAILFLLAALFLLCRGNAWALINTAFALSIALWAMFILSDEIFLDYAIESTHIRLFMLEVISLMAIHLL